MINTDIHWESYRYTVQHMITPSKYQSVGQTHTPPPVGTATLTTRYMPRQNYVIFLGDHLCLIVWIILIKVSFRTKACCCYCRHIQLCLLTVILLDHLFHPLVQLLTAIQEFSRTKTALNILHSKTRSSYILIVHHEPVRTFPNSVVIQLEVLCVLWGGIDHMLLLLPDSINTDDQDSIESVSS